MGFWNSAPSFAETVLGAFATPYIPSTNGATQSDPADRLFTVGNGTSLGSPSDALVMLKSGDTTLNGPLHVTSTLDVSGNTGLGTSTPAARLHVDGGVDTSLTSHGYVVLGTVTGRNISLDNNEIMARNNGAVSALFLNAEGGNVAIGTTNASHRLTVNGSAAKPGGGSWSVFSDERLKEIDGDYPAGLEAVLALQPIRYRYRADNALHLPAGETHVGFSAQAVRKVLPEAVEEGPNGYLTVNADPILWAMLNGLKQLSRDKDGEIRALRQEKDAEIAALKQEVAALRAAQATRLAKLERRFADLARSVEGYTVVRR